MAINTNPTFKPGQKLTPEQVKQMLALRGNHQNTLGQQAWYGGAESGENRRVGTMAADWMLKSGDQMSPTLTYRPNQTRTQTGEADNTAPDGTGSYFIYQPRNQSTWGGSDVTDVWDSEGNYLGSESGATDLRGLANWAASSVAAYYGASAMAGADGAASGLGAASGGADAATSAAWANGSGLGLDTVSAVGGAGGTTGTLAGAGTLSAESLGAIDGLSSVGTNIGNIGADSIISGTQAAGGTTAGTAGLSSADKAALYGTEGYGGGMTGAQTSVYDGVLKATGSTDLAGTLASNGTVAEGLNAVADGAKTVANDNGFGTLAKVVTTATLADAGADALSNPVDTSRFDQLFSNLLTEQGKASARGDSEWQDYINTWKPIQGQLADRITNYDTAGRREMAAQSATGDVATQFDQQRMAAAKQMQAAGLDPSTIAALDASSRIDEAKASAGAANKARSDVENNGLKLLAGGAEFGRGLADSSMRQSQIATGTTNAANSVLNTQGNLDNQNTQNRNAIYGDLLGTAASLYGMYSSSKKTKHRGGKVDGLAAAKAVQRSPSERWRYKAGQGDGNTKPRVGPMAEDLHRVAPTVSNGKQVDGIALAGLHHAAIGNVAKRLDKIEQRLGLGDAKRRA